MKYRWSFVVSGLKIDIIWIIAVFWTHFAIARLQGFNCIFWGEWIYLYFSLAFIFFSPSLFLSRSGKVISELFPFVFLTFFSPILFSQFSYSPLYILSFFLFPSYSLIFSHLFMVKKWIVFVSSISPIYSHSHLFSTSVRVKIISPFLLYLLFSNFRQGEIWYIQLIFHFFLFSCKSHFILPSIKFIFDFPLLHSPSDSTLPLPSVAWKKPHILPLVLVHLSTFMHTRINIFKSTSGFQL